MSVDVKMKPYIEPLLLVTAILIGSLTGLLHPLEASLVDISIIAMLFFLFYNISFDKFLKGIRNKKYLSVAWISNFIVIPFVAFVIASIFVDRTSAIFIGLIIYLVAPCTDWVLGFTKLAKGDTEINSTLLPINLLSQIILLPMYLYLFTNNTIGIPFDAFFDTLLYWLVIPFVAAQIIRIIMRRLSKQVLEKSTFFAEIGFLIAIIILVFSIFNSNIDSLLKNIALLPVIFIVIFLFFLITYFLIQFISYKTELSRKEEVSLTMTTAARNAPLMLGVSLALFPQEPLIHIVLVIGMLVEFPHLITLTYLLKR